MEPILEGEIESRQFAGFSMTQDGLGFTWIVVAVVVEEHDLAAEFRLEPPRSTDFRDQEAAREKAARLLAEADEGGGAHGVRENRNPKPRNPNAKQMKRVAIMGYGGPRRGGHRLKRALEFGDFFRHPI